MSAKFPNTVDLTNEKRPSRFTAGQAPIALGGVSYFFENCSTVSQHFAIKMFFAPAHRSGRVRQRVAGRSTGWSTFSLLCSW